MSNTTDVVLTWWSTREGRLLDAAIDVLGTQGMRELTHRAVDAAAPGFQSARPRTASETRESLLVGVLRRILERETAMWMTLAPWTSAPQLSRLYAVAIGRLLTEAHRRPVACSVRHDERYSSKRAQSQPASCAPRSPTSRTRSARGWRHFLERLRIASNRQRDVHHLLALMDGLVINQLTSPALTSIRPAPSPPCSTA